MMLEETVVLAAVTVLGVLEQGLVGPAYFSLQVIYARRKFSVSPPATAGPPEFERVFRAQEQQRPEAEQEQEPTRLIRAVSAVLALATRGCSDTVSSTGLSCPLVAKVGLTAVEE
ncbi:uncharacterized protein V6R79_017798 [Siganus canaliculatus]